MASAPSPPPPPPSRGISSDYFNSRPAPRVRQTSASGHQTSLESRPKAGAPGSPRTPLFSRSISSQFGSPSSFRTENDEVVVYDLGARHLSAGYAGEGRPRCVYNFTPGKGGRPGDWRQFDPAFVKNKRDREKARKESKDEGEKWGRDHELYRTDLRSGVNMELVEDKLSRAVREIHTEHLQLDTKPRKVCLAVPSLLPTPLLELVLRVLFEHWQQPPSIMVLTTPILATVGAGLRCALVIDVGWEETTVTGIGEYREVAQRRSVRAGRGVVQEMRKVLEESTDRSEGERKESTRVTFAEAEEVLQRMGWCRPQSGASKDSTVKKRIPLPSGTLEVPFSRLSDPAENTLFATSTSTDQLDVHELPLPLLAYKALLALPLDLRSLCISRIVLTGGLSHLPGLKSRLLNELQTLITARGWDAVNSYGSAQQLHDRILKERSANAAPPTNTNKLHQHPHLSSTEEPDSHSSPSIPLSPTKKPLQDSLPHHQRVHDDIKDPITIKAERHTLASKEQREAIARGTVRGVDTLGPWTGASLVVGTMRVKGVHEVEREEFLRHGMREGGGLLY
ncbi:fungal-specific actin related protein [Hortaea werneckii]|nr:fungal-specific actin related protein [Hortaea werneckii]